MSLASETIRVSGIRCERCVLRLGSALEVLDGIEYANANLMGELTLQWDDRRLAWDEIVTALRNAGFHPVDDPA